VTHGLGAKHPSRRVRRPGDVFWVFHDPGQALIRADVVAGLGLERHELFENRRNPESIAALAGRFYRGGEEVFAFRILSSAPCPGAGGGKRRPISGAASAAESCSGVSLDREKLAGAPGFEPGTP
jgi:hypothetical protein